MSSIDQLRISRVKGARSSEVDSLVVDGRGLFGDRDYMFVEAAPHTHTLLHNAQSVEAGHFISQREDPQITAIQPELEPQKGLWLRADGREELFVPRAEESYTNRLPLEVWDWQGFGVDQGDEAAEWASTAIGRAVRLMATSDKMPRYVEGNPALGRVGFADGYPVTLASTDAYDALNRQLEELGYDPITRDRTRTTLTVSGLEIPDVPGATEDSFPEDFIDSILVAQDGLELVLRRAKACGRCSVPDTNQLTGEREPGRPILRSLAKLGRHGRHADQQRYGTDPAVFFSQNFTIELPKSLPPDATIAIKKGADIDVTYADSSNWIASR